MKKKIVSPCTFIPDKLLCPGMSWGKITTSLSNKMLKIKSRLLFFFLYFFPSVLCPVPAHSVAKFQSPVSAWLPPTPQQRSRYSRPSGGRYECAPRDRGQNTMPTFLLQLSYTHGRRDFPLLQFSVSGQRTTSTACRIAKKKAFALQGR